MTSPPIERAKAGSVNIYRDVWGVAHLYASREEDGFYGLGYAMAQDQLEVLLLSYVVAIGRASELLGRNPKEHPQLADNNDMVLQDSYARLGRFWAQAEQDYPKLSRQVRNNIEAHTRGVEAYMKAHPEKLPDWWPRIRLDPVYQLAAAAMLGAAPSQGWPDGIHDCGLSKEEFRPEALGKWKDASEISGSAFGTRRPAGGQSNIWAFGPQRTRSGYPILGVDPHGGTKHAWESRMDAGELKMMALASFPLAYPATGHTSHQAWGWTTGGADPGDCYRVKLSGTGAYLVDGKPRPIFRQSFTFPVKGEKPHSFTAEHIMIDGIPAPIVAARDGYAYAILSAYMKDLHRPFAQMDAQLRARKTEEMVAATRIGGTAALNHMSVGSDGEIYWISGGRIMSRPTNISSRELVIYESAQVEPRGSLPFAEFVKLRNPRAGFMHNNNQMPDTVVPFDAPRPDDYRPDVYFADSRQANLGLEDGSQFGRPARIATLMNSAFDVTYEDAVAIAYDTDVPWAGNWTRALTAALLQENDRVLEWPADLRAFAGRAAGFNGTGAAESREQLAFFLWREALAEIAGDTSPSSLDLPPKASIEVIADRVETGKLLAPEHNRLLVDALKVAADRLRRQQGTTDLRFGDIFRIEWGNVSAPAFTAEMEFTDRYRGTQPLAVQWFGPPDAKGIRRWTGGSWATMVVEMGPRVRSMNAVQHGVSTDPGSPFHTNQIKLLSERRLKSTFFNADELAGNLAAFTVLPTD